MNKLRIICVLLAMGTLGCMSGCNTNALKTQNDSSQISDNIISSDQCTTNSVSSYTTEIFASSDAISSLYSTPRKQNKSSVSKSTNTLNTGVWTEKPPYMWTVSPHDGLYITNFSRFDSTAVQAIIKNSQNRVCKEDASEDCYFLIDSNIIIGCIEYNLDKCVLGCDYSLTKSKFVGVKMGNYKTFEVYSVKNKPATEGIILYRSNLWITILKTTPDSIKVISSESSSIAQSSTSSK